MRKMTKVRPLPVVLTVLISLAFVAGCGFVSDRIQAIKPGNEEQNQKKRDPQTQQARQEELEKQIEDLQKKVASQEQNGQKGGKQTSASPKGAPEEDIQNLNTPPSQAPEGVVGVSPDFNASAASAEEADVINAAIDYYQYAEIGDYYTTYDLLSSEFQAYYSQDEWVTANKVLDSAAGEFIVTDAYPNDLGLGVPTYAVAVTVYLPDGSSFNRTTYFIYEGSFWAHHLSTEEVNLFDDALY